MPRTKTSEISAEGLRAVRLLQGIPEAALKALSRRCRWRRYPAGQCILSRAAVDRDVYLIVAGSVRVTSFSAAGRQVTYRDIPAGDWFGDFAAIDGLSRSADVIALEDSLVASMEPAAFDKLLHTHRSVCDLTLRRLVTSVRELTDRVFEFSTLGVQNRVHAEVLRLARDAGVINNAATITPAPKHADIASHVSTYREQVAREFSAMVRQGLVRRAGKALVVPDVMRLQKLVEEVRR